MYIVNLHFNILGINTLITKLDLVVKNLSYMLEIVGSNKGEHRSGSIGFGPKIVKPIKIAVF
jgi:hypothetical protein